MLSLVEHEKKFYNLGPWCLNRTIFWMFHYKKNVEQNVQIRGKQWQNITQNSCFMILY